MVEMRIRRFRELDYHAKEAINTLCTNLSYAGGDFKKIMITSCHPEEGKSFVAMQLMRTLAQLGMRVVLVDADIRASEIQAAYGVASEVQGKKYMGLTRYLAGKCTADDILIQTDIQNAYMVLAGKLVNNSLPLLNTPRMSYLLDRLAGEFDIVLVDTPPVGTVADAMKLSALCDGTLLVVKYGVVRGHEFQAVIHQIQKTGKPILGTVLNQYEAHESKDQYYYTGGYYAPERKYTSRERKK